MKKNIEYYCTVADMVLSRFHESESGYITMLDVREDPELRDQHEVFAFLMEEGLLEQTCDCYKITFKGRLIVHKGGFKAELRRACFDRFWTYVAAGAGVVAAVISGLSLYFSCQ